MVLEQPKRKISPTAVFLASAAAVCLGSFAVAYFSTHPIRRRGRTGERLAGSEEVEFCSADGMRLSGWFIPAREAVGTVILCHGYPNNHLELRPWVEMLRHQGFNLLLFDFRAMGQSDGRQSTIGYEEVNDLTGALDYLGGREETRDLPIGVFGLSMGGAVALMTAADDDRIVAAAAHASYATLETAIDRRFRLFLGPLAVAVARLAVGFGRGWLKAHPRDVSPLRAIGKISPRPVLLFHGGRDILTRPSDSGRLFEAAGEPKTLHLLPRSWHRSINPSEREEYGRVLVEFFRSSLHSSQPIAGTNIRTRR